MQATASVFSPTRTLIGWSSTTDIALRLMFPIRGRIHLPRLWLDDDWDGFSLGITILALEEKTEDTVAWGMRFPEFPGAPRRASRRFKRAHQALG
jgi:hypothetical protein